MPSVRLAIKTVALQVIQPVLTATEHVLKANRALLKAIERGFIGRVALVASTMPRASVCRAQLPLSPLSTRFSVTTFALSCRMRV